MRNNVCQLSTGNCSCNTELDCKMHLKIINTWILTKLNGQYLYANQIPYLIGLKGTIFSYKIQLFVHKEFNCSN